jgi:hypothetical protein
MHQQEEIFSTRLDFNHNGKTSHSSIVKAKNVPDISGSSLGMTVWGSAGKPEIYFAWELNNPGDAL